MNWSNLISALIGAGFGTTALGVLFKIYLDHRLSIDRELAAENRLFRQKQREASTAIAEILSAWVHTAYKGTTSTNEDRWITQSTYWKNILLLDKELIDLLFPTLANKPGSAGSNELIVQARKVLLNLREPDIKASELNNWPPEKP